MTQQLKSLACNFALLHRQTSHVAARMRKARDETGANGIVRRRKDDGNGSCCLPQSSNGASIRENDIDPLSGEFGGNLGNALRASF